MISQGGLKFSGASKGQPYNHTGTLNVPGIVSKLKLGVVWVFTRNAFLLSVWTFQRWIVHMSLLIHHLLVMVRSHVMCYVKFELLWHSCKMWPDIKKTLEECANAVSQVMNLFRHCCRVYVRKWRDPHWVLSGSEENQAVSLPISFISVPRVVLHYSSRLIHYRVKTNANVIIG